MAGGDHGNERHEAAIRRDRVLELRDQGLTFKEIGADLGVTEQRAWQIHKKALRERPVLAASAERDRERKEAQLAQIDEQRRDADMAREAVMSVLTARHITISNGIAVRVDGEPVLDDAPVLAAVDRLVRLDELLTKLNDHEAKLLGLYAAVKQTVDATVNYTIGGGVDISALK
jgi:hypothetical protein